jgi:hypothetical protein
MDLDMDLDTNWKKYLFILNPVFAAHIPQYFFDNHYFFRWRF